MTHGIFELGIWAFWHNFGLKQNAHWAFWAFGHISEIFLNLKKSSWAFGHLGTILGQNEMPIGHFGHLGLLPDFLHFFRNAPSEAPRLPTSKKGPASTGWHISIKQNVETHNVEIHESIQSREFLNIW